MTCCCWPQDVRLDLHDSRQLKWLQQHIVVSASKAMLLYGFEQGPYCDWHVWLAMPTWQRRWITVTACMIKVSAGAMSVYSERFDCTTFDGPN
jgi:hypothetical protein